MSAIPDEKMKDWNVGFVWPVWETEEDVLPVWASLCREETLQAVSSRLSVETIEEIKALSDNRFDGELSPSAAVRLLVAIGLGVVRDVDHYAPEVLKDAVREHDSVRGNSARLVSMVSPLVSHAIGNYKEGLPYVS